MFSALNPILIGIYIDLFLYVKNKHNVELVITDTVSTKMRDKLLGRKSDAHRTARAIDVRTKDLDAFVIQDIIKYLNYNPDYKKYKYLSNSGKKRLAYYHIGTNEHLHIAIHKKYSTKN